MTDQYKAALEALNAHISSWGYTGELHHVVYEHIETIRTALQSTRKPDDKKKLEMADVISWADGVQGTLGTEYANRVTKNEAYIADCILRGYKNARKPPVDTIPVPREALQGVREALKYWIDGGVDYHVGEVALASLDAVLEGE